LSNAAILNLQFLMALFERLFVIEIKMLTKSNPLSALSFQPFQH
jgi:hypothetical protein